MSLATDDPDSPQHGRTQVPWLWVTCCPELPRAHRSQAGQLLGGPPISGRLPVLIATQHQIVHQSCLSSNPDQKVDVRPLSFLRESEIRAVYRVAALSRLRRWRLEVNRM